MPQLHEYDGWSYERLRQQRNRAHFLLEDPYRYVTVILSTKKGEEKRLYCLDSPCYHGAGPLGEGDLVEIEDMLCVRCPWHQFLVSLDRGEEILLESTEPGIVGRHLPPPSTYPPPPVDPATSPGIVVSHGKVVQRVHKASLDEASGILTIEVADEEDIRRHPVHSDRSAESVKDGGKCMQIFDIKAKGLDKV